MANSRQAEKRNRQRQNRTLRNRQVMGSMRTALKKARAAVDGGEQSARELVASAVRRIDKAVSKGALPRRTGSRLISRLVRRDA